MWTSDIFGLPPTNDWQTFKSAFIERKIWEYEQFRSAIQADSEVDGGFFTGPDKRKFLPAKPGRIYVKRKEMAIVLIGEKLDDALADTLFYEGIHPEGYEIIYIDDNGDRLTENSLPMLDDQDAYAKNSLSLQERIPLETQNTEDVLQTDGMDIEEKLVVKQQNKVNEPTTLIEKGFQLFLDSLSDNELVEFEKMLTEEFQEFTRKDEISDAQIETDFNELFTPARLSRAKEILDRSEPKEGISILLSKDPQFVTQMNEYLLRRKRSKK